MSDEKTRNENDGIPRTENRYLHMRILARANKEIAPAYPGLDMPGV